jgi:predicted HTH transcriptional regulator
LAECLVLNKYQNANELTEKELKNKLSEIEWEDFEVKEAKSEVPKSVWQTVSAFANTNGGWIIFGIKQIGSAFEIVGLKTPEKIEQDFLNTLRGNKFNSTLDTEQRIFSLSGKIILGFYIKSSNKKPIYFNTQSNTFIRRGSADQRPSKAEIDSMFRDQAFGTKTSEKVIGTSRESLNSVQ